MGGCSQLHCQKTYYIGELALEPWWNHLQLSPQIFIRRVEQEKQSKIAGTAVRAKMSFLGVSGKMRLPWDRQFLRWVNHRNQDWRGPTQVTPDTKGRQGGGGSLISETTKTSQLGSRNSGKQSKNSPTTKVEAPCLWACHLKSSPYIQCMSYQENSVDPNTKTTTNEGPSPLTQNYYSIHPPCWGRIYRKYSVYPIVSSMLKTRPYITANNYSWDVTDITKTYYCTWHWKTEKGEYT